MSDGVGFIGDPGTTVVTLWGDLIYPAQTTKPPTASAASGANPRLTPLPDRAWHVTGFLISGVAQRCC